MALVLALKSGQAFYVEHERFVVGAVVSEIDFEVTHERTGKTHHVTDSKSVEVLPDVFVSAGDRQQMLMARIAFEAPRSIRILRQEVYDQEMQKRKAS